MGTDALGRGCKPSPSSTSSASQDRKVEAGGATSPLPPPRSLSQLVTIWFLAYCLWTAGFSGPRDSACHIAGAPEYLLSEGIAE